MTSSGARAVPWLAVARLHHEIIRRAGDASFALPVTLAATERWSSLTAFEPTQLTGPWEVNFTALESPHLQRNIRNGQREAFIGGPCWYRRMSDGGERPGLEWIPLIYREVRTEISNERLRIEPAHKSWIVCPLVSRYLEQHNIQTVEPLDEMLPDLLSIAEAKAANDGNGLTCALVEAFQLVVPELSEVLIKARDDFPVDTVEFVPSPWVLFTPPRTKPTDLQHALHDYDQLERCLAATPQNIGGLDLLKKASPAVMSGTFEVAPFVALNDSQRSAVKAALTGRPLTVISGKAGNDKREVVLSILLNAWAKGTSVVFASNSDQAIDVVRRRLKTFESDFEIAVLAGPQKNNNVDEALGRTLDLVKAKQSESHYGGSLSARKRVQLTKRKQRLRGLLNSQVPQRVSQAIEAALESHVAQRQALSKLASQREELLAKLRNLGIEDEPGSFNERILDPLRKWRSGIASTRRLIEEDAQRNATLRKELEAARTDRDTALAEYQIEVQPDQETPWLLAEPGFESFEQAMAALRDKLQEPFEPESAGHTWNKAHDVWPSSEAAAAWERKARELASLIRPAGIALTEKTEEVHAAREALDEAQRSVQEATKTASLDIRREDLDEWAACYHELSALPPSKLAFLHQSRSAELIQQLEKMESRFRSYFPSHLWTSIGALDASGRSRLSAVVERAREWLRARDDWERLGPTRDEIEAETEALRRRLVELGARFSSAEVTPAACAAIAAKLKEKASIAASAAAAWSKREARQRLPAELVKLAAQTRTAGAGTPIKERWTNGGGAPLIAALGALESNPGVETIKAVRHEVLGSAAADPVRRIWQRAYEAEKQAVALADELERIPSREARLSHWKSRRPASLPATIEASGAFDGDDAHPIWAFLQACEAWSQRWATYRREDAPVLEQTAKTEGARAVQHIREAAKALPECEERTWLESFANGSSVSQPWPVEEINEKAALWRPQRLQTEIEQIDAQLARVTFEIAKEQWLERVGRDPDVLRSLDALRNHLKSNGQRIEENDYTHFKQALKAQAVWITGAKSAQTIPMQPGLFDLVVIDDATQCTLTEVLPLVFRAKRLVVIGDPEQPASTATLGSEVDPAFAAQFDLEEWAERFGHAGHDAYLTAVSALPAGQADVISLAENQ